MESSKRILQWRGFIFVAAAFVYFFVGLCVGELLVNFHLFLVTTVLFHSPLSSTIKLVKVAMLTAVENKGLGDLRTMGTTVWSWAVCCRTELEQLYFRVKQQFFSIHQHLCQPWP